MPKTKLFFSVLVVGAVFVLFASACSHSEGSTTSSTGITTTTTVELTATTSTANTVARPPIPTEPQVLLTTEYILEAKPPPFGADGRIRTQEYPVYKSPDDESRANRIPSESLKDYKTTDREGNIVSFFPTNPNVHNQRLTFVVVQSFKEGVFYPRGIPNHPWAEVILSTRPNGSTGWIKTDDFTWKAHNYHIIVNISDRTVSIWKGTFYDQTLNRMKLVGYTSAIVGRSDRQTPVLSATTYVEAKLQNDPLSRFGSIYGTWILALAAFSEDLEQFNDGIPQLAIHGTSIPENVGEALSSGCVRIPNSVVELLARDIDLGTPVSVIA